MTGSALTRWTLYWGRDSYLIGREFEGGGARGFAGAEAIG